MLDQLNIKREGWVAVEPFPVPRPLPSFVTGDPLSQALRARYYLLGDVFVGRAWFGPGTQGPPGSAHGGSVAALLDEVMGAQCWALQKPVLAGEITVRFLKRLPLLSVVEFESRIVKTERKKIFTEASLVSIDQKNVFAKATGVFIQAQIVE